MNYVYLCSQNIPLLLYYMYRLDEILRARGMRKSDFAEKLGISKQSLSSMTKNPSLSNMERIAKALDIPMWRLFRKDGADLDGSVITIDGVRYRLSVVGSEKPDVTNLYDNVTARLKELGMTKKELSIKIGIRQQNMNKLLVNPSLDNLASIAEALGCSIDDICK